MEQKTAIFDLDFFLAADIDTEKQYPYMITILLDIRTGKCWIYPKTAAIDHFVKIQKII